eukprot:1452424-Ditylum_brightwellii.AAC.1
MDSDKGIMGIDVRTVKTPNASQVTSYQPTMTSNHHIKYEREKWQGTTRSKKMKRPGNGATPMDFDDDDDISIISDDGVGHDNVVPGEVIIENMIGNNIP